MGTKTQAGTAGQQGRLWSVNAAHWAELQEPYVEPAYVASLDALGVGEGTRLRHRLWGRARAAPGRRPRSGRLRPRRGARVARPRSATGAGRGDRRGRAPAAAL